ncbi:DNA polymerase II [Candidatus Woesearchaeota archaeon]|nr:DNA polymerase II [Candidatus Woesearchaeota archaeon]
MKGFVLYPTYRILNGKPHVLLFGKLENGQSFLTINSFRPYFYIEESHLRAIPKEYDYTKTEYKNFGNEKLIKVFTELPQDVPKLRGYLEERSVECYEADVRFAYRFLIDNNIKSAIEISGEDYEQNEYVDRIYHEPAITAAYLKPSLKVFSIDIETSKNGKKLYSISIFSENFQRSLIVNKKKTKNAVTFKDEESLLEKFKEIIIEEDPDVITGWSVIDFDLKFLMEKFKQHKISFVLGRTDQQCKLKIESDFFKTSKSDFQGRLVLDAIGMLKGSFIQLENYKLSTAASHFLNQDKLIDDYNKAEEIESLYKKNPEALIEYNLKDAQLVLEIIRKTRVLDLAIHRSLLTGMPLDRVSASIASFDSLYLRRLKERGYVAPSASFKNKETRITGGYVMESFPGIYENIIILDFKSLYPSIIRTFNIDPLTFVGKNPGRNLIVAPNRAAFKKEPGLLPEIIAGLMEEREKVKREKDELTSYAIKILLNSMFGVMANPSFRFFNTDMANAITHFGQFLIKLTAEEMKKRGYEVIYSDTDSIFVKSGIEKYEDAETEGRKIAGIMNAFFEKYISSTYGTKNHLELEFEKVYKVFLMPKIRSAEAGAKKRYAGLRVINGEEKIEFTGMESRRRDWTDLAKKFQHELLNKIFHKEEVSVYVKSFIDDVRNGKYDDLLVYRKSIRKSLEKYTKTTPPHVKAARKLKKVGSSVIEYVITEDGPEPIQNKKHKIDYNHYINKQLKPIADSILIFYNKKFDDLIKGSRQVSLFNF